MVPASDSVSQLLEGRHYATLATVNDDGSILLTPVWYLFEENQLFISTSSSSRKARNLAARPNASFLVDIRKPGDERWASASGPAELLKGEESIAINQKIHLRYLTAAALSDPRVSSVFAAAGDTIIRLRPAKWRTWDAKDFDRQFFGGILTANPEKWFLPLD